MDKIKTNIKERVLQIAKNQNISYETFFNELGISYSNFKGRQKETSLQSDAIDKILTKYPDVDIEWLITGKEKKESLKENIVLSEPQENYGDSYKDKYIEILEENRELQKKVINLMEINSSLKKYSH